MKQAKPITAKTADNVYLTMCSTIGYDILICFRLLCASNFVAIYIYLISDPVGSHETTSLGSQARQ